MLAGRGRWSASVTEAKWRCRLRLAQPEAQRLQSGAPRPIRAAADPFGRADSLPDAVLMTFEIFETAIKLLLPAEPQNASDGWVNLWAALLV